MAVYHARCIIRCAPIYQMHLSNQVFFQGRRAEKKSTEADAFALTAKAFQWLLQFWRFPKGGLRHHVIRLPVHPPSPCLHWHDMISDLPACGRSGRQKFLLFLLTVVLPFRSIRNQTCLSITLPPPLKLHADAPLLWACIRCSGRYIFAIWMNCTQFACTLTHIRTTKCAFLGVD